ncbi:MAG: hypothetical protein WC835_02695, partial [Candidatus Paceibacterota bacterium]
MGTETTAAMPAQKEAPALVFDEVRGEWRFIHGKWSISLGWNPQFMRIGNDVVLVSGNIRRMAGGDAPK